MDKTQLSCFRVEPSAALFCLLASYLPYLTQPAALASLSHSTGSMSFYGNAACTAVEGTTLPI